MESIYNPCRNQFSLIMSQNDHHAFQPFETSDPVIATGILDAIIYLNKYLRQFKHQTTTNNFQEPIFVDASLRELHRSFFIIEMWLNVNHIFANWLIERSLINTTIIQSIISKKLCMDKVIQHIQALIASRIHNIYLRNPPFGDLSIIQLPSSYQSFVEELITNNNSSLTPLPVALQLRSRSEVKKKFSLKTIKKKNRITPRTIFKSNKLVQLSQPMSMTVNDNSNCETPVLRYVPSTSKCTNQTTVI